MPVNVEKFIESCRAYDEFAASHPEMIAAVNAHQAVRSKCCNWVVIVDAPEKWKFTCDKCKKECEVEVLKDNGMNTASISTSRCPGGHHCWTWAGSPYMTIPGGTPCDCGQTVLSRHVCPTCKQEVVQAVPRKEKQDADKV